MARSTALTYRDYAALPDDGRRYELHEGVLAVTPAPGPDHQRVARNLLLVLQRHVEDRRLGELFFAPLDVILSETTVVQPDLVYVAAERRAAVSRRGIEGPPTLVVEILSPSTATADRAVKPGLYARHGVPCFWVVDPEARRVEAFVLERGEYRLAGIAAGGAPAALPPFPGLALVADALWP